MRLPCKNKPKVNDQWFTTLGQFFDGERQKLERVAVVASLEKQISEADLHGLVFSATDMLQLPIVKTSGMSDTERFTRDSNIMFMRDFSTINEEITLGADPEFILCDKDDPNVIKLLSSKHRIPYTSEGKMALAELAIGADYGLLELRPDHATTPTKLVKNIASMIGAFEGLQSNTDDDDEHHSELLAIKSIEAVEFNHKRQRLRELIDNPDEDFGVAYADKSSQPVMSMPSDVSLGVAETQLGSLCAYGKPVIKQGSDKILTAGGHLHFGGKRIKMLSLGQIMAVVRKFDKELLPIAASVETPAAELRQKYYGYPGEFRLKDYGFEYRTLSCAPFWPSNHKVLKEILKEAVKIIKSFR
jgi:hypothetical protein